MDDFLPWTAFAVVPRVSLTRLRSLTQRSNLMNKVRILVLQLQIKKIFMRKGVGYTINYRSCTNYYALSLFGGPQYRERI